MDTVYNRFFGQNPNTHLFLLMLGLEYSDFPHVIDINLSAEGSEIAVFCRDKGIEENVGNHPNYLEELTTLDLKRNYYIYVFSVPEDCKHVCKEVWGSIVDTGNLMDTMTFEERLQHAYDEVTQHTQAEKQAALQAGANEFIAEQQKLQAMEAAGELDTGRKIENPKEHIIPEGHLSDLKEKLAKQKEESNIQALRDSIK